MNDRTLIHITWRLRLEMLLSPKVRRFVYACNGNVR